ncbi:unnamed protein product [Closterium sp. NIES-53]
MCLLTWYARTSSSSHSSHSSHPLCPTPPHISPPPLTNPNRTLPAPLSILPSSGNPTPHLDFPADDDDHDDGGDADDALRLTPPPIRSSHSSHSSPSPLSPTSSPPFHPHPPTRLPPPTHPPASAVQKVIHQEMVSGQLALHRQATGRQSRVVSALTILKQHLFK